VRAVQAHLGRAQLGLPRGQLPPQPRQRPLRQLVDALPAHVDQPPRIAEPRARALQRQVPRAKLALGAARRPPA
jgi:hypothetical protein